MSQLQVRQHGAEERDGIAALDQQSREIFHIEVADHIRLILDINPDKTLVGMACCQCVKAGSIVSSGAAPCRAQAGDDPLVVIQPFGEHVTVVRI